jgi:hypothetical protein
VPQHQITLMDNATPATQLVEPGPRSITMKSVRSFTLLLTLTFGIFGLFAGVGSIFVFFSYLLSLITILSTDDLLLSGITLLFTLLVFYVLYR